MQESIYLFTRKELYLNVWRWLEIEKAQEPLRWDNRQGLCEQSKRRILQASQTRTQKVHLTLANITSSLKHVGSTLSVPKHILNSWKPIFWMRRDQKPIVAEISHE